MSWGEGCRLEDIYIYIYIYMANIWHMFTNVSTRVQGNRGGLGWGVRTPPPILGLGNTKKTCFRSELGGY